MRPILVVLSPPSLQFLPGVRQIIEPVHVQAFVPKAPVERLDERIVRRLSGLDEVESHAGSPGPEEHRLGSELRAIVEHQGPGQWPGRAELVEIPGQTGAGDLGGQPDRGTRENVSQVAYQRVRPCRKFGFLLC